jgi:creatinine amidohydrolase
MTDVNLIEDMTWQEVRDLAARPDSVAVVPIGAIEQHGPHLPLGTDTITVKWLCEQAASGLEGVAVAPTIPFGESDNHRAFPGTISVSLKTLSALLVEVGESLFRSGFHAVVIINGHGGNTQTVAAAALDLRERTRQVVAQLMWTAVVPDAWGIMESPIVWHADESETSTMLAITPHLVHMDRAVDEIPQPMPFIEFTEEALLNTKIDIGLPPTHKLTTSGTIGEATLATAEKGHAVMDQAVLNLRQTIHDIQSALPALQERMTGE